MKLETLQQLFRAVLVDMQDELRSYSKLLCLEHGYEVDDLNFTMESETLFPAVDVSLTPALYYEREELARFKELVEEDLNNIVFDYAFNRQHHAQADEHLSVERTAFVSQNIKHLLTASQN
ncbi:MAG: hypothetical protein LUP95_03630 [Euryarchaeota archaeon]|nr:hypothetical protein [Euryarchaeota archaeon]